MFRRVIIFLLFVLAASLFWHNLTSINADIGRHLKLGEIIWQTQSVPQINLFSYVVPDYPFLNHHWLSEVFFYGGYNLGGLKTIMAIKLVVLLLAFWFLYRIVRQSSLPALAISFIFSLFVFSGRTEPRPEIFSYLFFAIMLWLIMGVRSGRRSVKWLWLAPVLQLFWVNMHVYFFLGPLLVAGFLLADLLTKNKSGEPGKDNQKNLKISLVIASLMFLVNLLNPAGWRGAIYPLLILRGYDYDVAENTSLLAVREQFGRWLPLDWIFLASLAVFILVVTVSFYQSRQRIFEWLRKYLGQLGLMVFLIAISFKMQRNVPFYALAFFPITTEFLSSFSSLWRPIAKRFSGISWLVGGIIIVWLIKLVVAGQFYNWAELPKRFGGEVSLSAQQGTEFLKENKISGPLFNNFDIGSYLIWQLYPQEKVFVDGRPEAYPPDFFRQVYRPLQTEPEVWADFVERQKINYVFFAHSDRSSWADTFLRRLNKDPEWALVFLNDSVIIFLHRQPENQSIIEDYELSQDNIAEYLPKIFKGLDNKDENAFINLGNALFRFGWYEGAALVFKELTVNFPDSPYGWQGAGYAYASLNDPTTQWLAIEYLERSINLGFKKADNYFTLGVLYLNLGERTKGINMLRQALKKDPKHRGAKDILGAVGAKP